MVQRAQITESPNLQPGLSKDAWNRDRVAQQVMALGGLVLLPTENLDSQSNQVVLLAGTRARLTLAATGTRIVGQPGSQVDMLTIAGNDLLLEGLLIGSLAITDNTSNVHFDRCHFSQVLAIPAGATIHFGNCYFAKEVSVAATGTMIVHGGSALALYQVADGGRGHWTDTAFYAASAVNNAGLAANCYITGCVHKSGVPHVNVTILSETT